MSSRDTRLDTVIERYEQIFGRLTHANAPEFLEIDITMPQAKILYLLRAAGDRTMSDLVASLGVTLPTVTGIVDRLVERGLAARHSIAGDRRRVLVVITPAGVALVDRFRDLNARQVRSLLLVLDERDLVSVEGFLEVIERGLARLAAPGSPVAVAAETHHTRSTNA